nr:unnamed protein product [Spirometra erinaceieuropaei]
MREKATWRHPRSHQWHLLVYVPVRKRDQLDVLVIQAIAEAVGLAGDLKVGDFQYVRVNNELARRLDNLPIAAADAAAENATVENRWCQLRDTVQLAALAVLGRARGQHQDWFDDDDAAINNPLVEKNRLCIAYVTFPPTTTKQPSTAVATLHNSLRVRCRTPGRLARPRRSKGTRSAKKENFLARPRKSTVRQPKELLLFSTPTEAPYSLERRKYYSDELSTFEASLTAPPQSPTPPSPV